MFESSFSGEMLDGLLKNVYYDKEDERGERVSLPKASLNWNPRARDAVHEDSCFGRSIKKMDPI
jgi:hypothetical protein